MNPINTQVYDQTDCTLTPGELIDCSGIYEICHHDEPRAAVMLMRNTIFPYCRQCGERVRYRLVQSVPHISEDPDFREDTPIADNPGYKMMIQTSTFPMQLSKEHGFRFHQSNFQTWPDGPDRGDL
ncbi:MAG TPA: hypothetical protein VFT65_18345 [Candidatus Angelobacter sp.]|nr:hypothetical protein [Candidatus Angelobacter sp.]